MGRFSGITDLCWGFLVFIGELVRYCHCLAQQTQRWRGALLRWLRLISPLLPTATVQIHWRLKWQPESAQAVTSVDKADDRYFGNNRRDLLTRSPGNIPYYEGWRYHNPCTPFCVSPSRPPHNLIRNRLFALKKQRWKFSRQSGDDSRVISECLRYCLVGDHFRDSAHFLRRG